MRLYTRNERCLRQRCNKSQALVDDKEGRGVCAAAPDSDTRTALTPSGHSEERSHEIVLQCECAPVPSFPRRFAPSCPVCPTALRCCCRVLGGVSVVACPVSTSLVELAASAASSVPRGLVQQMSFCCCSRSHNSFGTNTRRAINRRLQKDSTDAWHSTCLVSQRAWTPHCASPSSATIAAICEKMSRHNGCPLWSRAVLTLHPLWLCSSSLSARLSHSRLLPSPTSRLALQLENSGARSGRRCLRCSQRRRGSLERGHATARPQWTRGQRVPAAARRSVTSSRCCVTRRCPVLSPALPRRSHRTTPSQHCERRPATRN